MNFLLENVRSQSELRNMICALQSGVLWENVELFLQFMDHFLGGKHGSIISEKRASMF